MPDLPVSVVIAVPNAAGGAVPGIDAFSMQVAEEGGELLVVYTDQGSGRIVVGRRLPLGGAPMNVPQPPGRLTPHLWQAGISAATGSIVVLTLAGLVPEAGWLKAHLEAHRTGRWCAVGGPIMPEAASPAGDRAVAISRYSAFLLPFEAHEVADVAADNASYRRDAIDGCRDLLHDGFWEPPVHERMRREGWKLLLDPRAVMAHRHTNSFGSFIRQRLKHGFRFGQDRRGGVSTGWMVKYLLLSPLVPLVLTWRVYTRMRAKGRSAGEFLVYLPWLLCFNTAWSVAEVAGTILPPGKVQERKNERP